MADEAINVFQVLVPVSTSPGLPLCHISAFLCINGCYYVYLLRARIRKSPEKRSQERGKKQLKSLPNVVGCVMQKWQRIIKRVYVQTA
ncbi:hypothetical protein GDO81_024904 [Engystomops pustulosus]|uniref:Uncharacterized protein n=1 Tax=Engystomops pustulosus TaxID=76066 RepID=A0AAV6YQT3_ENGPU|nr:hypothetical protein GDO81_024904 [Engystomops pustulosus]